MLAAPIVSRSSRAAAKSDSVTTVGWDESLQETLVKDVMDPFASLNSG